MAEARADSFISLILFAVMLVSLLCALLGGMAQLLWYGQPFAESAVTFAFACAFVFGGAFFLAVIYASYEECRKSWSSAP
jgi:hypothetical protein